MADKNAVMRGLIGGILYDLMVKSNVYNIYVDDTTSLASKLNEIVIALNSKVKTSDIVNDLTSGGAEVPLSAEMGAKLKELIDEATFDETDPTVPDWAKQEEKPDYTAEEIRLTAGDDTLLVEKLQEIVTALNGKVTPAQIAEVLGYYALKSDIPEAVDGALTAAKESGEFDGAPGSSVYYYPDRLNEIIGSISLIPPEQINSYGREIRHGDLIISASGHLYKVLPNNGDDVRVVAQCLTKLQNGNLGYVEPVEVMHQIVVEDAENFNSSNPIPIGTLGLIVGQEYVVKWNGVSYTCIAVLKEDDDGSRVVTIGNVDALLDPSLNTAEPFAIGDVSGDLDGYIYPLESRTRFIISIYRNVYHKIDNRYLDLDWLPAANETTILEEQAVADGRLAAVDSKYLVDGSPVVVYINGIPHKSKIEYIKNDGWYVIAEVKDTVNIYGRVAFLLGRDNTAVLSEFMGGQSVKICLAEYDTIPVAYLPEGHGSGGTSAPSDWEADEGEPGHILNRPFYSEYKPVTLLETTTLTANGSFAGIDGVGFLTKLLDVRDGMECIVTYKGAAYNCTARATTFNDIPCCIIGNSYAFGDANTGEPFLVCAFSEAVASQVGIYGGVIPLDGSASFVISIAKLAEVAHKLPGKFVPDGVAGIVEGQTEIFPSTTLDLSSGSGNIPLSYFGYDFNEGETYTVKFNDLEFNCVARALNGDGLTGKVLGNFEGDTGEPFAIIRYDEETAKSTGISMAIALVDLDHSSAPVTLSILRNKVVHKLDDECLPDTALTRKTLVKNVQELSDAEKDDIRNEISPFNKGVTATYTLNVDGWEEMDGKYFYKISMVFASDDNLVIAFPADLDSRLPFYRHNCRYVYFNAFTNGVMCDTLPDKAFNVRFLLGSL